MKKIFLCLVWGLCGMHASWAQARVAICADAAGFPPYSYADPNAPTRVVGLTVDVVTEALRRVGLAADVVLLPWLRCLKEVEIGVNFSMLLDATYSVERAQKYWISEPLYAIHSALYYDTRKFPVPPRVRTVADMQQYRYCGIHGYNYSMYRLTDAQMDMTARNEVSRFQMLRRGRCDFVIADVEPLLGFVKLGQIDLQGLDKLPVPEFKAKDYFVLISKQSPHAEQLLRQFNESLRKMRADGTLRTLFATYGLTL